jgi:hypothetical protein
LKSGAEADRLRVVKLDSGDVGESTLIVAPLGFEGAWLVDGCRRSRDAAWSALSEGLVAHFVEGREPVI